MKEKLKENIWIVTKVYIMSYQPRPFSLVLLKVPAHLSDVEIRQLMMYRVRCIQIEPCDVPISGDNTLYTALYNRVVVHFDDFPDSELRKKIQSGYHSTMSHAWHLDHNGNNRRLYTHVLPYNSDLPQPPPSEYSHTVALQLQDIVRQQAEQIQLLKGSNVYLQDKQKLLMNRIQNLESKLNEMETRVHEGTELYMDINRSNTETIQQILSNVDSQKSHITALQNKQIELFEDMKSLFQEQQKKSNEQLKQQIDALTEWCSQPLWKRSSAFVIPKESNFEFISEF